MAKINWQDFEKIDIRAGTIIKAEILPGAKVPAYKLEIDLGENIGVKRSSAQITDLYKAQELVGRQVLCVTNFPPKQIGKFMSEVLTTGFYTEKGVVLAGTDRKISNGLKLA
jgi:tRNA-binding protein